MAPARLSCCIGAALVVSACVVPTDLALTVPGESIRRSHDDPHHVPDLVTFSDGFCTVVDRETGLVECRWAFSDGPQDVSLSVWPSASLEMRYDCVHPKTGRVASSGHFSRVVDSPGYRDITTGSSVVAEFQLDLPGNFPENSHTGKDKKLNACKSGNDIVFSVSRLAWWAIAVDNWHEDQAFEDYRYTCIATPDPYDYCVDYTTVGD